MIPRLPRKITRTCFFVALFILGTTITTSAAQVAIRDEQRKDTTATPLMQEDVKGNDKEITYLYDPTNKTDPFQSFITITEEAEEKEKKKPKTYLETLELSQLELIVIIIGSQGKWAMVRDSKGLGHVIREGTTIGTNGGVVHQITEGEVLIREEYKDFRGQMQQRNIAKTTPAIR